VKNSLVVCNKRTVEATVMVNGKGTEFVV
jgi:hypothetical protein